MTFPIRSRIVLATFLLTLLLYIDRVCISVAKVPILTDLGFTDKQMGWVLSTFSLGYALFQIPGGWLSDKLGPRKALAGIVSLWSVFTALTGAAWGFVSMLVTRFCFGVGEAGAFPGIARVSYAWIPQLERGIVVGVNFSGSRIGAAFSLPVIAWLIETTSWRFMFLLLGIIGVGWSLLWYGLFRNDPTEHPKISEKEKEFISQNRQTPSGNVAGITATELFGSENMMWMMIQYFCNNYTFFFAMTWLFPFMQEKFHLKAVETGLLAAIPLMMGAAGSWLGGFWVDSLFKRGKWIRSRRLPALTGFFFSGIGLLASSQMENIWGAIAALSLAIFAADMTMPSSWSTCNDIGGKNSGAVSGTMNMAGNLGSFATALAFPYLKDWFGSVIPFFLIGAALNFFGMYCWLKINPDRPVGTA